MRHSIDHWSASGFSGIGEGCVDIPRQDRWGTARVPWPLTVALAEPHTDAATCSLSLANAWYSEATEGCFPAFSPVLIVSF
jgi:hypothetical protein